MIDTDDEAPNGAESPLPDNYEGMFGFAVSLGMLVLVALGTLIYAIFTHTN